MVMLGPVRRQSSECWWSVHGPFFPLYLVRDPNPWDGAGHIQGGSSLPPLNNLEMPSQTSPQVCLLGL